MVSISSFLRCSQMWFPLTVQRRGSHTSLYSNYFFFELQAEGMQLEDHLVYAFHNDLKVPFILVDLPLSVYTVELFSTLPVCESHFGSI